MLVRPLLTARRQALLDCLRAEGVTYRQDVSNEDRRFLRNRLRHELVPLLLGGYNPALVEVLGRTSQQMAELQAHVTDQAEALLAAAERPRAGGIVVLERASLQGALRFVAREVFRLLWQRESWPMGEMNFDDWERLVELAHGAAAGSDFPGGVQARAAGRVLQVERHAGS
jgi:tRNA(Ile)-lysidine synthase